jgi:ribonuclease HI
MNYYAVAIGKEPGIYFTWKDCEQQVKGVKNAKFKKFNNEEEANQFLTSNNGINKEKIVPDYYVYTDGACSKNGAKDAIAGIGIYFGKDDVRNISKKIDLKPTNNVAELSAIIHACNLIEFDLKNGKHITIVSDSHYAILCATSYGKKNEMIGWKKEIPNKELVHTLYNFVVQYINLQFLHIEAHTNRQDIHSIGNHNADLLATNSLKDHHK